MSPPPFFIHLSHISHRHTLSHPCREKEEQEVGVNSRHPPVFFKLVPCMTFSSPGRAGACTHIHVPGISPHPSWVFFNSLRFLPICVRTESGAFLSTPPLSRLFVHLLLPPAYERLFRPVYVYACIRVYCPCRISIDMRGCVGFWGTCVYLNLHIIAAVPISDCQNLLCLPCSYLRTTVVQKAWPSSHLGSLTLS